MALKPKHRREIRDLLRILHDDKAWQPYHTDRLIDIVRKARTDVAEEVETTVARDAAEARRLKSEIEKDLRRKMREVDQLRESMKDLHAKTYTVLEALIDLPMLKSRIKDEDGNWTIDPSLISDKDAKLALQAMGMVLKVTGAMAPVKHELETRNADGFQFLGEIEADEL